jgi:hypothetical protein
VVRDVLRHEVIVWELLAHSRGVPERWTGSGRPRLTNRAH